MSNINIVEITTSDTIQQFMEKCNENFTSIEENGGGPRGAAGQDGIQGATGKRGNTFHFIRITEPVERFGPIEATAAITAAIENNEDIDDGDFVFFFVEENEFCYGSYIKFEENTEGVFVPVITDDTLVSLQGPKGEQGVPGGGASEQFDVNDDDPSDEYLVLRDPYQRIVLPKPEQALSSDPSSALCIVKGGIGFVSGDREKSTIKGSDDNGEFLISSELNISLTTKENLTIGEYTNGVVSRNINITGENINITRNGSTNKITLDQTNVGIYGKTKFDNNIDVDGEISSTGIISSIQKITSPSIETNDIKVTGLSSLGFVQINSNDGFNVGNAFKINPTNKKINITSNVESTQPIRAKVNNDIVELGVPKFTFMLYPKTANTPSGWCEFTKSLIMPIKNEIPYNGSDTSYQNGNYLYFNYKVPTTENGQTTYTLTYVKIDLRDIYQATFDFTSIDNVTTTTSNSSGISTETYDFILNESSTSESNSSTTNATKSPLFDYTDETTTYDYDITTDDDDLPWVPISPDVQENRINYHQQLIKHLLTSKNTLQDMSGIFTRMIIRNSAQQIAVYYILSVPEVPSSALKWIFKVY